MSSNQQIVLERLRRVAPTASDIDLSPETPADQGSSLLRLLICVALFSVPAATVLRPLDEFDTWWHLRTGLWIAEHRAVPETDLFATALEGRPWIAYSWLFELLLHGLYQVFGLGGIVLYRVALTLALVAVLHRFVSKREPRFGVAVALAAAALVALSPMLCERPWLFSILFSLLTLDAILDLRKGTATAAIWLLPLAYALWANLHIQFVYGLFLLALACAGPLLDALLGRRGPKGHADTVGSNDWWKLVALTLLCAGATLLNPYGPRLYVEVVELSRQSSFYQIVGEMRSLGFRDAHDWAVLGLALTAAFVLGRRARLSAFEVMLLAGSALVSFKCRRDLWLVVLASLAILVAGPRSAPLPGQCFLLTPRRALLLGLSVGVVLVAVCCRHDCSERALAERVASEFPAQAAAWVEAEGHSGPLYNSADWGSYLMWRLPDLPVAIDGRLHLYGDQRAFRFHNTCNGIPGWEEDPDLAAARLVILRAQAPLGSLLRRDPRFQLAHEDPVAVVFVRRED